MRYKKVYGQSRIETCVFCDKTATLKNKQGVPVCSNHQNSKLNDFKCSCGKYMDLKEGKYGIFFTCIDCGTMSLQKALSINQVNDDNNIPYVEDL